MTIRASFLSVLACFSFIGFISCDIKVSDISIEQEKELKPDSFYNELSVKGVNHLGDSVDFNKIPAEYILLEFWASWCPPCRQANPAYVKVYDSFRSKGFEILSISLDEDADKWKSAIQKDNLYWPYHLTDLKGWDSEWAIKYGIEEIPNNILFDKNRKIIAKELSPSQLSGLLESLFTE